MSATAARVATRFSTLLTRLEPLESEVARARTRIALIRARLTAQFHTSKVAPIGSHSKGTAIRGVSDVDVLAVLRREQLRRGDGYVSSDTLLNWIRDDLDQRFASTVVGRNGLAVTLRFGGGEHGVDVVPAVYDRPLANGHPLYLIPDGNGGWLNTAPSAHERYLRDANLRSGGKLIRLVRLLKHWRATRTPSIPLSSFHLELVLASEGVAEQVAGYSTLVTSALATLADREGAALRDPLHISGLVSAAATAAQRERLVTALDGAVANAVAAYEAEQAGQLSEALYRWELVFNRTFPS